MILNGFQRSFRFLRRYEISLSEIYHENQTMFFLIILSDSFCDSFYEVYLHAQAVLGSGAKEPFTVVGSSIRASESQRLGVHGSFIENITSDILTGCFDCLVVRYVIDCNGLCSFRD